MTCPHPPSDLDGHWRGSVLTPPSLARTWASYGRQTLTAARDLDPCRNSRPPSPLVTSVPAGHLRPRRLPPSPPVTSVPAGYLRPRRLPPSPSPRAYTNCPPT